MFEKEIIIDARGHLMGRLASLVAQQILKGQRVVVVRCEAMNISGSLFRNKLKYHEFLNLANNTNPRRQFVHYRSPSRIFWRVLRGMTPHKTGRGKAGLQRLKVFEGIPFPYDQKKRMVMPQALKVLRLKPQSNFCVLGDLASHVGWNKAEIVNACEDKRKVKSEAYYQNKQKKVVAKAKALKDKKVAAVS